MKCPKCGKEIANDSQFCEFCGKRIEANGNNKKKIVLWVTIVCVISFIAVVIGNRIYYNSDAYVKGIYSLEIPRGFGERSYPGRQFEYTDGKGGVIYVNGGCCYYPGVESMSQWFDFSAEKDLLFPLPKQSFVQVTINKISAMYAMGNGSNLYGQSCAYQIAYLYSEQTGCYSIICSYPPEKKEYYDEMMKNVIFSFREK